MALYTFKCTKCEHEFDNLQRMDAPNPVCSECSSETVKLLSKPNTIELKGDGYYKPGTHRC